MGQPGRGNPGKGSGHGGSNGRGRHAATSTARATDDRDNTYEEVMFHCGSTGHSHSFSKTLEVVIQKMASDLKNPELVIE